MNRYEYESQKRKMQATFFAYLSVDNSFWKLISQYATEFILQRIKNIILTKHLEL